MAGEQQKTILLVEDEVLIAHMEKNMLERYGYRVLTEYKGEKAIACVEETPGIDLILMDINLGSGMSGPEAAERILEKHDIPLIFLSSHSEHEVVSQAEKITSYGYVLKNSEETVLITSIRMAFRLFEAKLREKERNKQFLDSEQRWKALVGNSPDFIGIFDREGKVLFLNRYAEGFSEKDVIGTSGYNYIPPENIAEWKSHFEECLENRKTRLFINYGYGDNMTRRTFENYFIFLADNTHGPCVMGITKDITEKTEIQESLNREILEKEMLLKEVHHRIKNNLTAVEKIIQMQVDTLAENSVSRNILQAAIGRVESMRMIYEKLLNTSDYTTISTKQYLEDLIGKIRSLYTEIREIQFEILIEDFLLNSRQIFSLGIIANELISNIMKYAFQHERYGMVQISLVKSGGRVTFLVRDNGSGFPEGFNPEQTQGLGIIFINILTKQLDGTCTFESDPGVSCRVEFEA